MEPQIELEEAAPETITRLLVTVYLVLGNAVEVVDFVIREQEYLDSNFYPETHSNMFFRDDRDQDDTYDFHSRNIGLVKTTFYDEIEKEELD